MFAYYGKSCGYARWFRPSGSSLFYHSFILFRFLFSSSPDVGSLGGMKRNASLVGLQWLCCLHAHKWFSRSLPPNSCSLCCCWSWPFWLGRDNNLIVLGLYFFVCLITTDGDYVLRWSFASLLLRNIYSSDLPAFWSLSSLSFLSILWCIWKAETGYCLVIRGYCYCWNYHSLHYQGILSPLFLSVLQ